MTMDERTIHADDLSAMQTDVLLELPHHELEDYLRETRSTMDNAQMIHDRLRAVRMEKIRRECIQSKADEEAA